MRDHNAELASFRDKLEKYKDALNKADKNVVVNECLELLKKYLLLKKEIEERPLSEAPQYNFD
jgi:hypothetical protein